MHRREDEPYNPYPEETYGRGDGSPRGGHHHHHHPFGHQEPEGGPYGSNLEHRPPPPPPSRPGYEQSGPYGYGEGGHGHRPGGPYEEQRYEEQRYEDRRNPNSQYGPGPYGAPAAYPPAPPASGHSYGDAAYQTSPYSHPAPNPHHREEYGAPHRRQIPGLPVRLHTKADPNFSLAVVPGQGPVMKHTNINDDYQVWYKDESMGTRVKDETGASSFSLINKVTGEALRHPSEDLKQCLLAEYEPNGRDESVWWTMSEDMGQGYRCVRMATKITRNLDVLRGDKKSGGVKEGSPVITFAWKKQENQIWKMTPACVKQPLKACCGAGGSYNFNKEVWWSYTSMVGNELVNLTSAPCANRAAHLSWDGIHPSNAFNKHAATAFSNDLHITPPGGFNCFPDFINFDSKTEIPAFLPLSLSPSHKPFSYSCCS